MTSAWLGLQRAETTSVVARMSLRIWGYLYPPSAEKLEAGLSHRLGRARKNERYKEKRTSRRAQVLERKLKAGFLCVRLPGTCTSSCLLSRLVAAGEHRQKSTMTKGYKLYMEPKHNTFTHRHKQTYLFTNVCGLKLRSQRAAFPDVYYYLVALVRPYWSPCARSLLRNQTEGQKWAIQFHCCLYWAEFIKTWVSMVIENPSIPNGMEKSIFWGILRKTPDAYKVKIH